MSIAEKTASIKWEYIRRYPGAPIAFLYWTTGDPGRDFQIRVRQRCGTYSELSVVVLGDLRAPSDDENRYFARLQDAGACVIVCYCMERALDAIDSYMRLRPGQRFGEGIPVFKGGPG